MLILMIRSDQQSAELYIYQDEKCLHKHIWEADHHLAESINKQLEQLLKKAKLRPDNLDAIGVYSGPGSFTSLRIGHSVANALAYGLNLPIVEANGADWQTRIVAMLRGGENEHLVMPIYGAPARTTKPRK